MSDIEKYQGNQFSQSIAHFEGPLSSESDSNPSLIGPLCRRWYIVLLTFILVCSVGIPAIYFMEKPVYKATAAIRVAPVLPSILFGNNDPIPMYKNFMYTQTELITSDKVLQRVADDLIETNPEFFKEPKEEELHPLRTIFVSPRLQGPVAILRRSINSGSLTIEPESNTELIKISMKNKDLNKAKQVVNSFVQAYMTLVVTNETKEEDHKLNVLMNQRKDLEDQLNSQRQAIREMSEEYGTDTLTGRQQIKLQRVGTLQSKLTEFEMRKITLNVQMQLLKENAEGIIKPEELLKLRYNFINADLMVKNLSSNIVEMEQSLIAAKQILAATNPQLSRKAKILNTLMRRLEQKRKEIGKNFDEMVTKESTNSNRKRLDSTKRELEQITAQEEHLRTILAEEDSQTIKLGRKQLAIQDLQEQLNLTKDYYEAVKRGIQEIEMETKRPARISVAYDASSFLLPSKRKKYAIALAFGGMACGIILVLIRDKADLSLRTPEDITRRVGVRIVGTTTSSEGVKKSLIPKQIACDYQTIWANLGLYGGEDIPKILVITSAAPREGKTTLAINMATSVAKSGKMVLLIDGDLRKPDVAKLLNIKSHPNGLPELLLGKRLSEVVCPMPIAGLFVLTAKPCNPAGIHQLITQKRTLAFLNAASLKYDHIIIDSPPLLAVSDSLLWAKMSDATILTSFTGRTKVPDLKKAFERLQQADIKVLGTVLNDVPLNYSYNPYGYDYCTNSVHRRSTSRRKNGSTLLLPMQRAKAETRIFNS